MKVERKTTIGGNIVTEVLCTDTLTIYSSNRGEDLHYIVNNKTGEVECFVDVNPYSGEGGGGCIEVGLI